MTILLATFVSLLVSLGEAPAQLEASALTGQEQVLRLASVDKNCRPSYLASIFRDADWIRARHVSRWHEDGDSTVILNTRQREQLVELLTTDSDFDSTSSDLCAYMPRVVLFIAPSEGKTWTVLAVSVDSLCASWSQYKSEYSRCSWRIQDPQVRWLVLARELFGKLMEPYVPFNQEPIKYHNWGDLSPNTPHEPSPLVCHDPGGARDAPACGRGSAASR
jgi:hypothetical protein